jgi:hypothetical protein
LVVVKTLLYIALKVSAQGEGGSNLAEKSPPGTASRFDDEFFFVLITSFYGFSWVAVVASPDIAF